MSKGWIGCLVVAGAIVLIVLIMGAWLAGRYNGMVQQNEQINNTWAQVKVVLQRRADLIPNLVETVKGYASHEKEIFENVERFYHRYYLRPKPILRIIKTMLEDKDVCVRRLREGYEFFKSMAQRRSDLEAARAAT